MLSNQTLSMRGMSVMTSSTAPAGTGIKSAISKITSADISESSSATNDDKKSTEKKNEEGTNKKTKNEENANTSKVISNLKYTNPLKDPNFINRWDAANPGKPVSQDELISKYGFSKPSAFGGSATGSNSDSLIPNNGMNGSGLGNVINNYGNSFNSGSGGYVNNGGWGSSGSGPWVNPGQGGGPMHPVNVEQVLTQFREAGLLSDLNLKHHHGHTDGGFQFASMDSALLRSDIIKTLQQNGLQVNCKGDSCTFTGKGHHAEIQPKAEQAGPLMSNNTSKSSKETEPQNHRERETQNREEQIDPKNVV